MRALFNAIARTSAILTAAAGLIVAVSIPAGYFVTDYQYMKGAINADIALLAQAVEKEIAGRPSARRFEEPRLREILECVSHHDGPQTVILRDIRGEIIARTGEPPGSPSLERSKAVTDSGEEMAVIEIRRSIAPLLVRTSVIGASSSPFGILIFLLFRSFPLRAVRAAYRSLEENQQRLNLAAASGDFGIWEWNIPEHAMHWDDRMHEIYGVARGSVNAPFDAWQSRIHPDDRGRVLADFRSAVSEERDYDSEFRIVGPGGAVREIKANGVVIRDAHGNSSRMIGLHRDITEQKRVERELRESEQRYRELSMTDGLTQLYNSRHFYFQLKIEIDRANRYEQPLTLLMLDLDFFKRFNDDYGHVEGDQVLRRLGQTVRRCLRETDFAYRYGGEEFTVLLPMTTVLDGAITAERIRSEFKREIFHPLSGEEVHVTVSIGLGQYRPQEEMKAFVHRVDLLMYQGKREGGDRLCAEAAHQEEFPW